VLLSAGLGGKCEQLLHVSKTNQQSHSQLSRNGECVAYVLPWTPSNDAGLLGNQVRDIPRALGGANKIIEV
jgi:hypothetical protein